MRLIFDHASQHLILAIGRSGTESRVPETSEDDQYSAYGGDTILDEPFNDSPVPPGPVVGSELNDLIQHYSRVHSDHKIHIFFNSTIDHPTGP